MKAIGFLNRLVCCLPVLLPWACPAADVSLFGVMKSVMLTQTVSVAPAPISTNAYSFMALAVGATNGSLLSATVKTPKNVTLTLTNLAGTNLFAFLLQTNTQAHLDSQYPSSSSFLSPSTYTFTLDTLNDGVKTISVSYADLSSTAPPNPQISNLSAGQNIDSTQDFTVTWNSLGNGLVDIVQFLVMDAASNTVFSSPAPFQTGALTGSSTSIVIPAGTLPAGTNLLGHLALIRPALLGLATNYGIGFAANTRDTSFPLQTQALPAPTPAQLLPDPQAKPSAGTPVQLRLILETNRTYRLQGSPDLLSWTNLLTTNSPTGTVDFSDLESLDLNLRFYRAVSP